MPRGLTGSLHMYNISPNITCVLIINDIINIEGNSLDY